MSKPWECPVCHRGCAPDVKTCDHGGLTELARQLSDDSMDETRMKPAFVPVYPTHPYLYWPPPTEPWRVGDITCSGDHGPICIDALTSRMNEQ